LKAGVWFRRGRLVIIAPVPGSLRRFRAEIPLIPAVQIPQTTSIEGYFSVKTIADVMQKIGIDANDCLNSINYILDESLVQADNMSKLSVGMDDSVKISASGYVHLRILAERIEYLYGIIPTIPISDETVVAKLAGVISRENSIGDISARVKVDAVQDLYNFFRYQAAILAQQSGNIFDEADANSGTAYILRQMKTGIDSFRNAQGNSTLEPNLLD